MSFGFSVSDSLAVAGLIREVVSALNGVARFEYRELELELHGLQQALDEVEHLQPGPGQRAALNAIRAAALTCRYPLAEFRTKLEKYKVLSYQGSSQTKFDLVKGFTRKVQWNLFMEDEVQKLRAYLAAHTASLNMRLITIGLTTMSTAETQATERERVLRAELQHQATIIRDSTGTAETLYTLVVSRVLPRLDSLIRLVERVWTSNLHILDYFARLQEGTVAIDLKHTWFQEPIRFEDAFGRILPLPVEYQWSTIQAIILDRFSAGPGHQKISAGEYELFNTEDSSKIITEQTAPLLMPGATITMAVVIGIYYKVPTRSCPRPGCTSPQITKSKAGGFVCDRCKTWFGMSSTALPRPFRSLRIDQFERETLNKLGSEKNKRIEDRSLLDVFRQIRDNRKWYKNVRIHLTDWPSDIDGLDGYWQLSSETFKRPNLHYAVDYEASNPEQGLESISLNLQQSLEPDSQSSKRDYDVSIVVEKVSEGVAEMIGIAPHELSETVSLYTLGWDSLMMVQFAHYIREELKVEVPVRELFECLTIAELTTYLVNLLSKTTHSSKTELSSSDTITEPGAPTY